jgi:hypothetical protein
VGEEVIEAGRAVTVQPELTACEPDGIDGDHPCGDDDTAPSPGESRKGPKAPYVHGTIGLGVPTQAIAT